jgi:hypothetical protein
VERPADPAAPTFRLRCEDFPCRLNPLWAARLRF